jgi:ABC-type uncharacterized transport system permease subunit
MTIPILPLLVGAAVGALVATMEGLLTSFDEVAPVLETLLDVDD